MMMTMTMKISQDQRREGLCSTAPRKLGHSSPCCARIAVSRSYFFLFHLLSLLIIIAAGTAEAAGIRRVAGRDAEVPGGSVVSETREIMTVVGDNVELKCSVTQLESWQLVFWYHNTHPVSASREMLIPTRGRIFIDDGELGDESDDEDEEDGTTVKKDASLREGVEANEEGRTMIYNLVIRNVSVIDEGEYYCYVPSGGINQRETIRLIHRLVVNVPAVLKEFKPSDDLLKVEVKENSNGGRAGGVDFRLECVAEGKPTPTVIWNKIGDEQYLEDNGGTIEEGVLRLNVVDWRANGLYLCVADNGVSGGKPTSHVFDVVVLHKPVVQPTRRGHVSVTLGSEVKLNCSMHANPEPSEITWYHNDSVIYFSTDDNQSRTIVEQRTTTDRGICHVVSTLTIQSLEVGDVGIYRCLASNKLGEASEDVILIGAPYDVEVTSDSIGPYSDQFNLEWTLRSASAIEHFEIKFTQMPFEVEFSNNIEDFGDDDETIRTTTVSPREEFLTISPTPSLTSRISPHRTSSQQQQTYHHIFKHLQPGTRYSLSLRAKNIFDYSDWTPVFIFETNREGHTAPLPTTVGIPRHHYLRDEFNKGINDRSSLAVIQGVHLNLIFFSIIYSHYNLL